MFLFHTKRLGKVCYLCVARFSFLCGLGSCLLLRLGLCLSLLCCSLSCLLLFPLLWVVKDLKIIALLPQEGETFMSWNF